MKKIIAFIILIFCTNALFAVIGLVTMEPDDYYIRHCPKGLNGYGIFEFKCKVEGIPGMISYTITGDNFSMKGWMSFNADTKIYTGVVDCNNITKTPGTHHASLRLQNMDGDYAGTVLEITFLEDFTSGSISSTGQLLCENNIGSALSIPVLSSPTKGGGSYSYQWERTAPNGNTSIVSNTLNYKPNQSGTYKLLVTDTYCNESKPAVGAWEVKTQSAPVQPPVPSGSNGVCQGSTQTYKIDPINNANNYVWSLNNSNAGQITNNGKNEISIKWNEKFSGNVQLSVKAENVGTLTCQSPVSNSLAVTVYEIPSVPNVPSGPIALCQGASAAYKISNASSNIEYIWKLDNPDAGEIHNNGESEVIVDWNRSFSGTAALSVSAQRNGCQSAYTAPLSVNISPQPEQPAQPMGNSNVCQGSTETYNLKIAENTFTYTWSLSNPNAGTIQNDGNMIAINWNPAFTGTVQLSVSASNNKCQSTSGDPLTINVYPVLSQPMMPQGNAQVYQGATESYQTALVENALGYVWSLSNSAAGVISNNGKNTVSIAWNKDFSGKVQLYVATASDNCQSSASESLSISVFPMPKTPSRPIGETFVCQGKVSYYEIDTNDTSVEYVWKLDNGNAGVISGNSTRIMIQWNPDFMGKVGLSVAAASKEQTVFSDYSKPLIIDVNPVPVANFIDYKTEICSEGTIYPQATYSVEGLSACMAYFWEVTGGEIVSGQETDKIEVEWKPENNKSGEVILTSSLSSGCSARQVLDVNFCSSETSVTEAKSNTRMSIYPSPNKGNFIVTFSGLLNEIKSEARLQISASNGQLLREKIISGFKEISFNEDLASGYYLLSLVVDGKVVATESFLVMK